MSTRMSTRNGVRPTTRGVAVALVVLIVAGVTALPAAAKKKPRSCTILEPAEIEAVVGATVTGPGEGGTLGIGCDFDIGPGLGDPGGGLVVIQVYSGTLAKNVWNAAKAGEKVGKLYWDPIAEIASGWKKPYMVAASITYTGGPMDDAIRADVLELVQLTRKKL